MKILLVLLLISTQSNIFATAREELNCYKTFVPKSQSLRLEIKNKLEEARNLLSVMAINMTDNLYTDRFFKNLFKKPPTLVEILNAQQIKKNEVITYNNEVSSYTYELESQIQEISNQFDECIEEVKNKDLYKKKQPL
jgi:hypothetical protein